MRKHRKLGKGFTLIELLVVILILAILAALIVPRVVNRSDDAKIATANSDIANLRGMLHQFKLDTGRYPSTEEGLNALYEQPADVSGWKKLSDTPIGPDPWGTEYVYEYDGGDSFTLLSMGSDKQPGGEGNAADLGLTAGE